MTFNICFSFIFILYQVSFIQTKHSKVCILSQFISRKFVLSFISQFLNQFRKGLHWISFFDFHMMLNNEKLLAGSIIPYMLKSISTQKSNFDWKFWQLNQFNFEKKKLNLGFLFYLKAKMKFIFGFHFSIYEKKKLYGFSMKDQHYLLSLWLFLEHLFGNLESYKILQKIWIPSCYILEEVFRTIFIKIWIVFYHYQHVTVTIRRKRWKM